MSAANRAADRSPRTGADQAPANRALAGIIRVRTTGQYQNQSRGDHARSKQSLHRSVPSQSLRAAVDATGKNQAAFAVVRTHAPMDYSSLKPEPVRRLAPSTASAAPILQRKANRPSPRPSERSALSCIELRYRPEQTRLILRYGLQTPREEATMKAMLGAFTAVLLAGAICTQPAQAQPAPQGSYLGSCTHIGMRGDRLFADCRRMDGGWQRTVLDVGRCVGDIGNFNGSLTCNRAPREGYGSSR
jgi:hypothetical protein